MPFTISAPKPASRPAGGYGDSDSDSDASGADVRMSNSRSDDIVTPGEIITDDAQWMRLVLSLALSAPLQCPSQLDQTLGNPTRPPPRKLTPATQHRGHGTLIPSGSTSITASVAGTVHRTNKLLSVRPLRARFTPEVGDLVVGRVVEVQARRWRVDVGAPQLAALPLSAINLPGGILRKRTETDELAMRSFFAEGDVLVAEVQQLFADGAAVLHARSLRYGKLRNGGFFAAAGGGGGGGGGVVRSRRQVWSFAAGRGGEAGRVDVVLGVNGYVFVGAGVAPSGGDESGAGTATVTGITNKEEGVSASANTNQNDTKANETKHENAHERNDNVALVENGLKVDEDMVMKGYHEALEESLAAGPDGGYQ